MRAALYLRTSTKPKAPGARQDRPGHRREQTVENQRIKLQEFAAAMDWTVVAEYADQESGAKANRPRFREMMAAAGRREFDVVLVWSLDRFSREGIGKTCDHLRKLASYKVAFRSHQEPFLDTTGDLSELIAAMFAFFASFERKRIIERVKAGMDRARSQGKHLGRPKLVIDLSEARRLRAGGSSVRKVAATLGVSGSTAHRLLNG